MRNLPAKLWRVKRDGVQAVPKNFMQEAFLQRLLEEAIRNLLAMPGQELCCGALEAKNLTDSDSPPGPIGVLEFF